MKQFTRTWRLPATAALVIGAMGISVAVATSAPSPADNYVSDVTLVTRTVASNSTSDKHVDVYCPAGKRAIGGGADIGGGQVGSGTNKTSPVHLHRSAPLNGPPASEPTGPTDPTTGWRASAFESTAFAGSWGLKVYAICAKVDSAAPTPGDASSGTSGGSSGTTSGGSSGTSSGDASSGTSSGDAS